MRTTTPASTWAVMTAWGESTTSPRQLHAAVDRPGCMSTWRGDSRRPLIWYQAAYSRSDGHQGLVHALVLHPQGVDDVGLAQLVEREAHLAAERLDPARDQRRRPADRDLGAHLLEGEDVRARDAGVQDVADDPDVAPSSAPRRRRSV